MMDYDFKANVTTILTFFLMPIFASLGIDSITGNAMVGVAALIIFYVAMYVNERYLSNIFTKKGYEVVKEPPVSRHDGTLNHKYDSPLE